MSKNKSVQVTFKRFNAAPVNFRNLPPSMAHYHLVKLTNKAFIPLRSPGEILLVGSLTTQENVEYVISSRLYEVTVQS